MNFTVQKTDDRERKVSTVDKGFALTSVKKSFDFAGDVAV
jgi:hypothetical protein